MKVTVDTNVLVRAVVGDDPAQASIAAKILLDAETVVVGMACLCELVWVLRKVYGFPVADIAAALRVLIGSANVRTNRDLVEAGIQLIEAGGDFADSIIADEGLQLGGETFVSFDRKAVALLKRQGRAALLL